MFGCHAYVLVPKEKQSKLDPRSSLCRYLGYLEHEKAYCFEEISTRRIIVSRDAQFMDDTFENGKREIVTTKPVEFRDERDDPTSEGDCGSYDHANHEDMDEQPVEQPSAPTRSTEQPQWHQSQHHQQPHAPQQPNVVYTPGSKRQTRTHSLENLSQPPVAKRYGRVGHTNGTSTPQAHDPRTPLDDLSAMLTSIDEEHEPEACSYIVVPVGDLPTSFVSAMESSDATKWKEACESEFESLTKNKT